MGYYWKEFCTVWLYNHYFGGGAAFQHLTNDIFHDVKSPKLTNGSVNLTNNRWITD